MSARTVDVRGRAVELIEAGTGDALVYLHDIADIHAARPGLLPFHEALANEFHVIAPAHPGCAGSDENDDIEEIEDVVFHLLEVLDALSFETFALVGAGVGGWIAAEFSVRYPDRVSRLVLLGATGLHVPDQPIGDIFMAVQSTDGGMYPDFRRMLFAAEDQAEALAMFPDGLGEIGNEMLRYRMFRFLSRVGFRPPYLYNRTLRDRLYRYDRPALIIWGSEDQFVPGTHADAYVEGLGHARLEMLEGAGHSTWIERPGDVAALVSEFLRS